MNEKYWILGALVLLYLLWSNQAASVALTVTGAGNPQGTSSGASVGGAPGSSSQLWGTPKAPVTGGLNY